MANSSLNLPIASHQIERPRSWCSDLLHFKAIQRFPTKAIFWLIKGDTYFYGMRRSPEAIESYMKGIEIEPQNAQSCVQLARLYANSGQQELALSTFQRASVIDPRNADSWNGIGYTYFLQGKVDEAITGYLKAIECDPKNENAWINLVRAYAKQSKKDAAAEACVRISVFNPVLATKLRTEIGL